MKKNVNVQTTTETKVTITEHGPAYIMEIDVINEPGTVKFYRDNGIKVAPIPVFGKDRLFAFIPVTGYDEASDTEKADLSARAKAFNAEMDNYRRTSERRNIKVASKEILSYDGLMEAGYDPTLDVVDVALSIPKSDDEDVIDTTSSSYITDYAASKAVHSYYNPSSDTNNPEYIVTQGALYKKLHDTVDFLEGEDADIISAIKEDVSERKLADKLGTSRTTLQGHRRKLMEKCKDALKDYYN